MPVALSHWTSTQTKEAEKEKVAKQGVKNDSPETYFFDTQCGKVHQNMPLLTF